MNRSSFSFYVKCNNLLNYIIIPNISPRLYISQLRSPSFCNTEGLFGIFDGGTNQEAPSALQEMIPRLLLEERTIRETTKDYLKYTLLASHRELKEKGQKYGVDATLIHITKIHSPGTFSRAPKKYTLRISSCGETKAVLCRAAGPLVLAPSKKPPPSHQLGNASMFPLVTPDPTSEEVALEDDDEFIILANKKVWEVFEGSNGLILNQYFYLYDVSPIYIYIYI